MAIHCFNIWPWHFNVAILSWRQGTRQWLCITHFCNKENLQEPLRTEGTLAVQYLFFPWMKALSRLTGCTYTPALLKSDWEQDTDPLIWFCPDKSTHQMKSVKHITNPTDIMQPNTASPPFQPCNLYSPKDYGACLHFYVISSPPPPPQTFNVCCHTN